MKLTELDPQFVVYRTGPHPSMAAGWTSEYLHHVDTATDAQGIIFFCPACIVKNSGVVGTHKIEVSFADRGVQDHQGSHNREGKPSRWQVSGSGYTDLTLHPSVDAGCWHGFITNGEIK